MALNAFGRSQSVFDRADNAYLVLPYGPRRTTCRQRVVWESVDLIEPACWRVPERTRSGRAPVTEFVGLLRFAFCHHCGRPVTHDTIHTELPGN